jgi:GNAT superfamily N-acetyltransferase
MNFLAETCSLSLLNDDIVAQCNPFCCGDEDLDDFFNHSTGKYKSELLGKSYCYLLDDNPKVIVAAFTLSNAGMDTRHLPGSRRKHLHNLVSREKHLNSYPAMLVGRLGVNADFSGRGVGKELLQIIENWAIDSSNKSACRFITVDAYNNAATRKFYETNGFIYLFSSEQQEKEYIKMKDDDDLKTRLMYFDLLRIA